jgi:hypothetical protein
MSSVLRFQKQRPSNTLVSDMEDQPAWLYSTIAASATTNSAVFTAPSVITMPTQAALQSVMTAIAAAPSTEIDQAVATRDMGETLYLGVEGEDSTKVVFKLVQIIQGANQGWIVYICVQDTTSTLDVGSGRGAW